MIHKGSCLCGKVRYEIHGNLTGVLNCHCSDCRKAHGAAFRTRATVQSKDFIWSSSEDLVTHYEAAPGEFRTFCSVCGSNLVTKFKNHPEVYGFPLGTLDTDPGAKPECHVFVSDKAPWHEITDGLPQYPEALPRRELVLRDAKPEELELIFQLEQGDARQFIMPYSFEQHQAEFARPDVLYKSIWRDDEFLGFVILVLDPDGQSVELRRIIICKPGHGYGKKVLKLIEELCRIELGRNRIWLDVFETNARARRIYEQFGFRQFGKSEHQGRVLLLYETSPKRA